MWPSIKGTWPCVAPATASLTAVLPVITDCENPWWLASNSATKTTIDLNTDYKNATLKVVDVLVKELKSIKFSGKQIILAREELKAGMYFIQIISENKTIATNKIIIN